MSSAYEYDYKLMYQPPEGARMLIISAPSIEELKVAARKDSKKNGRAPERYLFEYTTSGLLFSSEEARQCNVYNSLPEEA